MSDGAGPVVAVVLGHGALADGMVSAVENITGQGGRFAALSNTGLSTDEILIRLRELLDRTGARLVFTDLPAGSCNHAACRVLRERPDVVVVTGANLPALLTVATADGAATPRELAERAVARGAPSVRVITGPPRGD